MWVRGSPYPGVPIMKKIFLLCFVFIVVLIALSYTPPNLFTYRFSDPHYVKGIVESVKSCFSVNSVPENNCFGTVISNGKKYSGEIVGNVKAGQTVYLECKFIADKNRCSKVWRGTVGERFLQGGELKN